MIYASFIIHRCNFPTVVAIKIHSVDQHDPETKPARDLLDRDFQFPCHCSFDTTFSIQRNVDEAPRQRTPWKQTYGTIFGVTIMGRGFKYFNVDASDASERTRVSTRYRNYAVPEQPSIYPCIVSIQLASGPICFWVASLDNWLCAFCRAVSSASIAVRVSNYRKMRGRSRDGQITIVKESQDDGGDGWRCEDSWSGPAIFNYCTARDAQVCNF